LPAARSTRKHTPSPRIALTGGIGSGKSTVAGLFACLGVPVIDADVISRQLVEPGTPLLAALQHRFGAQIITGDGALDRRALRKLIFSDAQARADLEALIHPAVRAELLRQAAAARGPYALLVIPLLVEAGLEALGQRVLVVDCDPEVQLERVRVRDGVPLEQAQAILAAQTPRAARLAVADDVINNRGNLADLRAQVEALHLRYRALPPPG
jgi:dephospho-CoA kinase